MSVKQTWAVMLWLWPVWGLHAGVPQFVEVTAEIETIQWSGHFKDKPPVVHFNTWTTRCVVGTNSWLIEQDFGGITHDAWWYTGSNITAHTVLLRYPSDRAELFARNHPELVVGRGYTKVLESRDGASVAVRALDVGELRGTAHINIAWLAFCSGPYLQRDARQIPLPANAQWPVILEWKDKTTTYDDELGLPTSVELYTTNSQPVCQYRTLGSTNVLGWNFPLKFYLAEYRRNFGTGNWELDLTALGKLISIGAGNEPRMPTEVQQAVEK